VFTLTDVADRVIVLDSVTRRLRRAGGLPATQRGRSTPRCARPGAPHPPPTGAAVAPHDAAGYPGRASQTRLGAISSTSLSAFRRHRVRRSGVPRLQVGRRRRGSPSGCSRTSGRIARA
jgi:hypothetical protein